MKVFHIDEFKCTLCSNWFCPPFNLPYLLKCSHSICTNCLKASVQNRTQQIMCPQDMSMNKITNIEINQSTKKALQRLLKQHKNFNKTNDLQCIKILSLSFDQLLDQKQIQLKNLSTLIDQIFENQIKRLTQIYQKIKTQINRPFRIVNDWKQVLRNYLKKIKSTNLNHPKGFINQLNHYIDQGRKIKLDLNQYLKYDFNQLVDYLLIHSNACFNNKFTIFQDFKPKNHKNEIQKDKNITHNVNHPFIPNNNNDRQDSKDLKGFTLSKPVNINSQLRIQNDKIAQSNKQIHLKDITNNYLEQSSIQFKKSQLLNKNYQPQNSHPIINNNSNINKNNNYHSNNSNNNNNFNNNQRNNDNNNSNDNHSNNNNNSYYKPSLYEQLLQQTSKHNKQSIEKRIKKNEQNNNFYNKNNKNKRQKQFTIYPFELQQNQKQSSQKHHNNNSQLQLKQFYSNIKSIVQDCQDQSNNYSHNKSNNYNQNNDNDYNSIIKSKIHKLKHNKNNQQQYKNYNHNKDKNEKHNINYMNSDKASNFNKMGQSLQYSPQIQNSCDRYSILDSYDFIQNNQCQYTNQIIKPIQISNLNQNQSQLFHYEQEPSLQSYYQQSTTLNCNSNFNHNININSSLNSNNSNFISNNSILNSNKTNIISNRNNQAIINNRNNEIINNNKNNKTTNYNRNDEKIIHNIKNLNNLNELNTNINNSHNKNNKNQLKKSLIMQINNKKQQKTEQQEQGSPKSPCSYQNLQAQQQDLLEESNCKFVKNGSLINKNWHMQNINFLKQWKIKKDQKQQQPLQIIQKYGGYDCQKQKDKYIKRIQQNKAKQLYQQTNINDNYIQLVGHSLADCNLQIFLSQFPWTVSNIQIIKLIRTSLSDSQMNQLLNFLVHSNVHTLMLSYNNLTEISLDALLNFVDINKKLKNIYVPKNNISLLKGNAKAKINLLKHKGINLYI